MRVFSLIAAMICLFQTISANEPDFNPSDYATISSDREDGRLLSSYAIARQLVRNTVPICQYREGMSPTEFATWQDSVRQGMRHIMKFPAVAPQPSPVMVKSVKRDGYTLEKWEFYPLPDAVSTF